MQATSLALTQPHAANTTVSKRLPSPHLLKQQMPLANTLAQQVQAHRQAIGDILQGHDQRLLVIVGPCSLHDPRAALEYADRLATLSRQVGDQLLLVMRAYVEKPRTTVGWKGLAYDPHLDGSDDMHAGIALSRGLMLSMIERGLPVATELLQPMAAGYFEDVLAWAAIGARTTESQVHREMVSGLELPVGFKNGTDGGVAIATDAMRSAAHPHRHFGMDAQGYPAIIETLGNAHTHLVLRGGHQGPNYDAHSIALARQGLAKAGLAARIMVDCSHANSGKDPSRQPAVFNDVLQQRLAGDHSLIGMMIEGHLFDGCQALGKGALKYGVSVTDACLGWACTETLLQQAAQQLRETTGKACETQPGQVR
ncbi:3-deoxy-7-phosphoheptulonate synthase [Pseudomonas sp. S60]|uniref:3-deoxy-7-phosphoheptulonate synthase n=1 Tax=Pseudomonas sp. S60 TaxID=211124 RepID=UPI0019125F10|nr:3-deoxy-7-phosphoheptulonate synthase [Pseudomonas sp. S60]MBK5010260.1 3-deoxy-7-phosphoheptulonate synthase [Pseudomonas sp. S60]